MLHKSKSVASEDGRQTAVQRLHEGLLLSGSMSTLVLVENVYAISRDWGTGLEAMTSIVPTTRRQCKGADRTTEAGLTRVSLTLRLLPGGLIGDCLGGSANPVSTYGVGAMIPTRLG